MCVFIFMALCKPYGFYDLRIRKNIQKIQFDKDWLILVEEVTYIIDDGIPIP